MILYQNTGSNEPPIPAADYSQDRKILRGALSRALGAETGYDILFVDAVDYRQPTVTSGPLVASPLEIRLREFYELSGLTWTQISTLFEVSVRYVHFWLDGERPMSAEHIETLSVLMQALQIFQGVPTFKVRRLLESKLLNNDRLRKLAASDSVAFARKWADVVDQAMLEPGSTVHSKENNNRENPFMMMGTETNLSQPLKPAKMRRVRVQKKI